MTQKSTFGPKKIVFLDNQFKFSFFFPLYDHRSRIPNLVFHCGGGQKFKNPRSVQQFDQETKNRGNCCSLTMAQYKYQTSSDPFSLSYTPIDTACNNPKRRKLKITRNQPRMKLVLTSKLPADVMILLFLIQQRDQIRHAGF